MIHSHYVCGPLQIQKRVEIETLKERFGCRHITLVGDKGMIKSGEIVIAVGERRLVTVPRPDKACKKLLKRVNVTLPEVLPYQETHVATRKKLNSFRKRK